MVSSKLSLPSSLPLLSVLLVLLQLLQLQPLLLSSASLTTYNNFQQLNVIQSIKQTKILHPYSEQDNPQQIPDDDDELVLSTDKIQIHPRKHSASRTITHRPLKLNLIHRDKLPTATSTNHTHRLLHRLQRDINRVAALTRLLSPSTTQQTPEQLLYTPEEFGSEVISGMDQGSGEYFVRVGVGSPPKPQYMVIDTGSDVVWVQCQPCNLCYKQSDPVFDPTKSATFTGIPCRTQLCNRLENSACNSNNRCLYSVLYSDGSYTKGTLALETLTVGSTRIRNVAMGCGHRNRGMFIGAAGLIGLGGGSMSLVGQLGGQTGGAFSYCLVSRGGSGSGSLEFGQESLPVGAAWVNLIRNPQAPSFYYVGLSGLGVSGTQIPIPESLFTLSSSGEGGVVMDTGTAVTRLPDEAYVTFRDTFREETVNLPRAPGLSIFDTCYDLAGFVSVRVPTVSFYFKEGSVLTLPARNFLIPVDDRGTFCFAFAPSGSGLSIVGNIQQEGIQISIDGSTGSIGFGPSVC